MDRNTVHLYEALEISKTSTQDEIKKAYRYTQPLRQHALEERRSLGVAIRGFGTGKGNLNLQPLFENSVHAHFVIATNRGLGAVRGQNDGRGGEDDIGHIMVR